LMGFIIAIPLFVVSYMRWLGTRWRVATISALLMLALVYGVFELAIGIDLYRGIIFT
jgi:hypothetical protein